MDLSPSIDELSCYKMTKTESKYFFLIRVQRNNSSDTGISRDAYVQNKFSLIIDKKTLFFNVIQTYTVSTQNNGEIFFELF